MLKIFEKITKISRMLKIDFIASIAIIEIANRISIGIEDTKNFLIFLKCIS